MKNKTVNFDSKYVFLSIKKIIIFDRKAIVLFVLMSLILATISATYYSKIKTYSGYIQYSYINNISDLGEVELINYNSFENFYETNGIKFNYIQKIDFPRFHFKLSNENLISETEKEVNKLLSMYKKFLYEGIESKVFFFEKNAKEFTLNETLKLKYTLYLIEKNNIFYNKKIHINYPDSIHIFYIKFFALFLLTLYFIRLVILTFNKKIKLV